jgi:hypothetical protein
MILFADIITYGTFVVAVLFIAGYAWWSRGKWHETVMGWHLMSIAASEALVFGFLASAHFFPGMARHEWFRWLYLSCVASIGLVTLWRLVILWIVYHPRGRHER